MKTYSFGNHLLISILDQIFDLIPCVQSSIYLIDGGYLKYLASRGVIPPEKVKKYNFPLEKTGGAYIAIKEDRPVLVSDVKDNSVNAVDFQESAKVAPDKTYDFIGSWIGFPIKVGGETIALLDVCNEIRGFYQADHVHLISQFIKKTASAIENAILVSNLSYRTEELETIISIQQAIHSHLNMNVILKLIADHALRLTEANEIHVFLREADHLNIVTSAGAKDAILMPGFNLPLDHSLVAEVIEKNEPIRILNASKDERVSIQDFNNFGIRSMLIVPLRTSTKLFGLLMAVHNYNSAFGPNDERTLSMLASGASVGIDNAQLYCREQHRRFVAESMQKILVQLSFTQTIQKILENVTRLLVRMFQADAGFLFQIKEKGLTELVASFHLNKNELSEPTRNRFWCDLANPGDVGKTSLKSLSLASPVIYVENLVDFSSQFPLFENFNFDPNTFIDLIQKNKTMLQIGFFINQELLGFANLFWKSRYKISQEDFRMAETVGNHVALAIDRNRLAEKELELIRLQERQRIAQNLHDTVTQLLFRTGLEVQWVLQQKDLAPEINKRIKTVQHFISRSTYELRSAIFALNIRQMTKDHNLVDLLQSQITDFQNEYHIKTSLNTMSDPGELPFSVIEVVYRLVREGLSNIYKHAKATAALVSLRRTDMELILKIQDNGVGLPDEMNTDADDLTLHFGLDLMKQLVAPLNGQFLIFNNEDQGVTLMVTIPLTLEGNNHND